MVDISEIEQYISRFERAETKEQIEEGVNAFLQNHAEWKQLIEQNDKDGEKYGKAFAAFIVCLSKSNNLNAEIAQYVSKEIGDYESRVKRQFNTLQTLYLNMGLIWHSLGYAYDDNAIAVFKKVVYYLLALSNNASYSVNCFAFRPCSKYLYHSLIKEKLNLSSPTQFNDPFDCPIMELLNKHGDDISRLMHQAYRYTTKVACFVSNNELPKFDIKNNVLTSNVKHVGDEPEYLNELMWAHYADSHKGVCIKYRFPNSLTKHAKCGENVLSYFRDVRYSNDVYNAGKGDTITMNDAFFLKSKSWKYENELRYLYFDYNGDSDYEQVDIPGCVSAVYFGLKCPEEERQFIMKLLEGKTWKDRYQKIIDGKTLDFEDPYPIEFYQIKLDDTVFGKLKAEKL